MDGAQQKLHLDDSDIRNFQADPETFHLSVMLGAGGIEGGMAGICRQLKIWTRGGGYVLIGEGYWQRKPHPDYLRFLGGPDGQYLDHAGNVQAGVEAGLIPMQRDERVARRVGRIRMEVLPLDRAVRARATRGSGCAGHARTHPALA